MLLAPSPGRAVSSHCDDVLRQNFVFDYRTGMCSCPGEVQYDGVSVWTCMHDGPNEINVPVAGSPFTATSTAVETQNDSQLLAAQIDHLGSSGAATVAVGVCAQGANQLPKNKGAGGVLIGSCLEALDAAQTLKGSERKALENGGQGVAHPELEVQQGLYEDPSFQLQAESLKSKYGLGARDFVNRTLGTKGSRPAFGKILKGKVSEAEYKEAFDAASAMPQAEREKILADAKRKLGKVEALSPPMSYRPSLRDRIYEGLRQETSSGGEAVPSGHPDAEDGAAQGMSQFEKLDPPKPGLGDLRALDTATTFGAPDEADVELSLFDVVHRKYHDKELIQRLKPRGVVGM